MTKASVCLALSLLAAPAMAGTVYVVVPETAGTQGSLHSTEVWISNSGTAQRPFSTTFLPSESDGTKRNGTSPDIPVPAGRTFLLANVGTGGRAGLLEVASSEAFTIEGRLVNTSPTGVQTFAPLPVISSANLFAAGQKASVMGLERDPARGNVSHLGIVNLGQAAAQCEVRAYRSDSSQIASAATVSVPALSMRQFKDMLGLLGEQAAADARAQVSCTQPFYAFGAIFTQPTSQLFFATPAASGASTLNRPGDSGGNGNGNGGGTGNTPGSVVYQADGHLHTATTGNPKRILGVPVSRALNLKKMIVEVDFVPGPWNRERVPGNHAIIWVHRGKFRSNSVCNVNAFGPNKFTVKSNQNVDMPAGTVTAEEMGLTLEQGKKYHLRYVYDAETLNVTTEILAEGAVLKRMSMPGTASNRVLTVPATGLVVEFGHYPGQEGPEIPSYGWSYSNLKIEMIPY